MKTSNKIGLWLIIFFVSFEVAAETSRRAFDPNTDLWMINGMGLILAILMTASFWVALWALRVLHSRMTKHF